MQERQFSRGIQGGKWERGEEGRGRREGRERREEEGGEEETPSTSTGATLAIRYQIEVFEVPYESS